MTHLVSDAAPDFNFISQHLFTAVLWIDDELIIKWLSPQAEQLLAVSHKRLINRSILTLLAENAKKPNSNIQKAESLTQRFKQAQQYQQPFIDHDHPISLEPASLNESESIIVDYSVTPVLYEQQPFFIIEMWGKNRQSRISDEQRQQQQYELARQMLRSVAHEVKNPLAGIRGAAQLLQRQFNKYNQVPSDKLSPDKAYDLNSINTGHSTGTLPQKMRAYTDIIISETDRLTQLIGQLLGSNQLPNWQMLNIHEALEHVLILIHSQYPDIIIKRDYDLSLPELSADRDPLIQVFLNLLNNACQSMTDYQQQPSHQNQQDKDYQPTVYIQTRIAFQHTIGSQQHKQVLQVTITDNGGGIDSNLIGQIFFPMVTHRATGTGLGLSIVQDIISRHHGMIKVSSNQEAEPRQTCFTIYLPFAQPAPHL